MISDGCGYNCFKLADLYQYGQAKSYLYDSFPVQFAVSTYSASSTPYDPQKAWESFDFVLSDPTDSAAAGTALAAGVKTKDGIVGLDPEGSRLTTIIEVAEALGKKTGTVTSVPFCHATPATFLAHVDQRYEYGEIAQQIIQVSAADVVMGCGHPYYDRYGNPADEPNFRYVEDQETWKPLVNNGKGVVPEMEWHSEYHTNSLVPLFAKGYGSERFAFLADELDPVRGFYLDNTEIGLLMIELLNEQNTKDR